MRLRITLPSFMSPKLLKLLPLWIWPTGDSDMSVTDALPCIAGRGRSGRGSLQRVSATPWTRRASFGWLMIDIAIRIAQDLILMKNPDPGLSATELEESRWCFSSVYLVDKLICCGRNPQLIPLDDSRSVLLPRAEKDFRARHRRIRTTTCQMLNDGYIANAGDRNVVPATLWL